MFTSVVSLLIFWIDVLLTGVSRVLKSPTVAILLLGACVYFWAFYLVPLVYISVLCQYHTDLMIVALWYNLKSGRLIPPAPFFFLKTALTIWGLLCFNMDVRVGLQRKLSTEQLMLWNCGVGEDS